MKKLHTYTPLILITLLSLLTTNLAMGQEMNIPIKTITATPNNVPSDHTGSGHQSHVIENIIDGNAETTWISDQFREIKMLDFLQLSQFDNTDNGMRNWIEVDYVPNQYTEIEIDFSVKGGYTYDYQTQYLFGCGTPRWGSGISLGIIGGEYVYKTSNRAHENIKQINDADGNRTTIITKLSSIVVNGEELTGTITPADRVNTPDEITGTNKLNFFSSPGDDQKYARSFEGKIYSVKIRENGKLCMDLMPAVENGLIGFYDRISTNFYPFNAYPVDYVENINSTDSPKNNVHVKIPLSPEPASGYEWSKSLVKNGYLTTNNLSSFIITGNATNPARVANNGTNAVKVSSTQRNNYDWDSQLFIDFDEPLLAGESYYISFAYRASASANVNVYMQGSGNDIRLPNNASVSFGTEWKTVNWTGTIPADQMMNKLAFHLNVEENARDYYITNIVVKKQVPTIPAASGGKRWSDNLVHNGTLETDDASGFDVNPHCTLAVDGNAIKVVSSDKPDGENPFYSQMYIKLGDYALPGEKVYISFDYKADTQADVSSEAHHEPGSYNHYSAIATLSFGTNWKTYSNTITISSDQGKNGGMGAIALNLNELTASNTYYLRNVVIRKETILDPGKKWSDNLFSDYDDASGNKTGISMDGSAYVVTNSEVGGDAWASLFRIIFGDSFKNNDKYYISFSYTASKDANVNTYLQGDGGIQSNNTPLQFAKDTWKTQVWEGVIGPAPHAITLAEGEVVKYLTFHLNETKNQQDETTTYKFRDIVIRKQVDADPAPSEPTLDEGKQWSKSLVKNGSLSTDNIESYTAGGTGHTTRDIAVYDGKRAIRVINDETENGFWRSCLFLNLDEEIKVGEKFYVSFDYAANKTATITTGYDNASGSVGGTPFIIPDATTSWQSFTSEAITFGGSDPMTKIDLFLNNNYANNPTTFYFTNIVVKKMVPIEEDDKPASELTINFQGLNENTEESYSVRHLFSLGTHEDEVMALNTRYGKYNYVSGGITKETNITIDQNEHTATFKAGECKIDNNDPITVSGVPTWNSADALYLMGTHCDPVTNHIGYAPRSFYGQIYSATLTENGIKRLDLIPAMNKDGEYGFIDKLSNTFYGIDGCSGTGADGKLGGGSIGYGGGAQETGDFKMPFKIDFTIGPPQFVHKFAITTAKRETGEQVNYNNPLKWVLYGSNNGSLWKQLKESDVSLETNGETYKYTLTGNTESFSQYRFIVEKVNVANSSANPPFSRLRLADIALSTNYVFDHYHGRVYDNSSLDIPENLRVGGTSGYQTDWKTSVDDSRLKEGVTLQRTHEYEHVVYVWPGNTVNLTPFSDFADNNWAGFCYREQYIRWYDYVNDNKSNRLTFNDFEGRNVNVSGWGHFAWNLRDNGSGRRTREGAVAIYTADSNPTVDDYGVIDVIAIEAAMDFDINRCEWINDAFHIKEPTIQWRHTFVIKDARVRANKMNPTENETKNDVAKTKNQWYIEDNKITLMCPAGTPFQYPLPSFEYAESKTGHPTDFYNTDGTAIEHYLIETTKGSDIKSTYLEFGSDGKAVSDGNKNTRIIYSSVNGSLSEDETAYSYKAKDGYNRVFYMLNPQVGTYTIKIYALEAGNKKGMQLMEYELQVLPPDKGNQLIPRETLYHTGTDGKYDSDYKNQIPSVMDDAFGQPTTWVDFDNIDEEEVETVLRTNLHKPVALNTDQEADGKYHYSKWPWKWEDSSYGFGYEDRGDYNMYMVADHMAVTPNRGINNTDDTEDDLTTADVFDVRYYEDIEKGISPSDAEKGYFFYANAASDPSRMAVLDIGKDFCPNTKVYVSAWINEVQHKDLYAETANVIFSFRGVDEDGTETVLNSFVTGYVSGGWNTPTGYFPKTKDGDNDVINHINSTTNPDNRGKWMHVYYTFSTDSRAAGFDHYIITLENNCTSSEGADYAIDDIRCYVRKPQMSARFMQPVCNDSKTTEMELYGDFDLLSDALTFGSGEVTLNYCFLDREKYEEAMLSAYNNTADKTTYPSLKDWRDNVLNSGSAEEKAKFTYAYNNAFDLALLKVYDNDNTASFGTLTLNSTFTSNTPYPTDLTQLPGTYYVGMYKEVADIKNIFFSCKTNDGQIKPGKTYILAVVKRGTTDPTKTDFQLEGKCSASSDFVVPKPTKIKIDGKLQTATGGDSYCANQRPQVDIDLNGVRIGGEPVTKTDVSFDWYYGPMELGSASDPKSPMNQGYTRSFETERKNEDLHLHQALENFRDHNPTATEEDVLADGHPNITITGSFTNEMFLYIKELVVEGRLTLYKESAFAAAQLFGENLSPAEQQYFYMTALPIDPKITDVKFCLEPINVSIKINELTPMMKDGEGQVTYPTTMHDVPLRIGLKQLKRAVISDLDDASTKEHQLWVPLRAITPVTEAGHAAGTTLIKSDDDMIYLVASNDPWADDHEKSGAHVSANPTDAKLDITSKVVVIGKILDITAVKGGGSNVCKMAFLKDFKFREGYWYTIKLHFKQEGASDVVCPGDLIFTIKVVPEYQMWTGATSRNWNDDSNWKRVTKEDLLWKLNGTDVKDAAFLTANADYTTDGDTNDNTFSYAPADFTKVIIPAELERVPFMYNLHESSNTTSIQYTGAPESKAQLTTANPVEAISDAVGNPVTINLDGKLFVITDGTGMNTLGVSTTATDPQNAFAVTNSSYTNDMYVYAKFAKVNDASVKGDVYTIQLCNANGTNYQLWGKNGYLNFQSGTGNVVFALGLGTGNTYGEDGENLGLWRVAVANDGITIQNVGRNAYLNPSVAAPSTAPVVCKLAKSFSTAGASEYYQLPSLVQYEMASVDRDGQDVACRPWYDHTCDQIHFNAGAEIMDQRYLYYNKAWCDIDVPVGTWQTVASPLMNIVAGDLYLPTATARQQTPLFEDIEYKEALNDRFAPAVFQRSWNKSMAKVYELGVNDARNVGIKLDWSHVYNDVNVRYGAGQGFSIKVDVSSDLVTNKPAYARFRFPKADVKYTYYNPNDDDGSTTANKREEDVNGNDAPNGVRPPGRLADLSGSFQQVIGDNGDNQNPATPTQYFLVGNPLMCWLDMQKFFDNNTQFERKYWIATANGQRTALFSETNGWLSTSDQNARYLAPGVSFFVQLNQNQQGQAGTSTIVTPTFTSEMMSYTQGEQKDATGGNPEPGIGNATEENNDPAYNGQNNPDGSPNDHDNPSNGGGNNKPISRSMAKVEEQVSIPQLRLTAEAQNGRKSVAVLTDGTMVKDAKVETLFDSNLRDDIFIYTTKYGQAMTITDVAPGDTLPLIISGAEKDIQLHIKGAYSIETPLYIYDTETGDKYPLGDDITLMQSQNGVKYYILADPTAIEQEEVSTVIPHLSVDGNLLTISLSGDGNMNAVRIYTVGGITVAQEYNVGNTFSITLPSKIYIVDVEVDGKRYTYKIAIL